MSAHYPEDVSASDPHITGHEEAPDRSLYCPVCHYDGPMEGHYTNRTVALYHCPDCGTEQEVEEC